MFWVRWINFVNGIGLVHPKMKIMSLITHPHDSKTHKTSKGSKPIRLSFISRTQIKIFLMKSEDPREYHAACVWRCRRRIWHSISMHFLYNVFMNVLKCHRFGWIVFHWRDKNLSGFIKSIFICALKIHKSLVWNIKGWVSDDRIFIFVWTSPLKVCWRWS